jgi:hypothetical protein
MATIFAANESKVLLNGQEIEGVQGIDYRYRQVRENAYGLGSTERIGVVSGPEFVEGRVRVVSSSPAFNALAGSAEPFQITAELKQGATQMTLTFDDCFLSERTFGLDVGGAGEAVYAFTATRLREETPGE